MPGGHFAVRTPHSCTIGLFGIAKFETQMLSLPSTFADQGPGRPPPVKGEPGYSVPSGRNTVMLPPFAPPVCFAISLVKASSPLPPLVATFMIASIAAAPLALLPRRLDTHTLPWLSIPRPLPL